MTKSMFTLVVLMFATYNCGCGHAHVVMNQVVDIQIRDRATLKPVPGVESLWRIGATEPKPLAKCDPNGFSHFTETQGAIVGATPLPFSATMVKHRMESRDYVSGRMAEIVVIDSIGRDTCAGAVKEGARLEGERYCVNFVSIRRAKMELWRDPVEKWTAGPITHPGQDPAPP